MLVELFLLSKKNVLSKGAIEEKLYAWGEEISSNAVEVHIHHIRRKLGSGFIRTIHGIGYTLGQHLTPSLPYISTCFSINAYPHS